MPKAAPKETTSPANEKSGEEYDAKNIQVLGGMEAVRKRPAMYIGDVGVRGLHHLVYEVVDNSVDEALGGFADRIDVVIHSNNSVSVTDNGRGIPVDIHKGEKKPAVEVVLTLLHAGGKFDKKTYKVSGGLHGVGVSVVNALSEWLEVEVRRDGKAYHMRFERGKTVDKLKAIGKSKSTGTKVTFKADKEIFHIAIDYNYDLDAIIRWVRADPIAWPAYEGEWMPRHNFAGPEQMVELVQFMLDHGYPEGAITGILGGNFERVANAVWK